MAKIKIDDAFPSAFISVLKLPHYNQKRCESALMNGIIKQYSQLLKRKIAIVFDDRSNLRNRDSQKLVAFSVLAFARLKKPRKKCSFLRVTPSAERL